MQANLTILRKNTYSRLSRQIAFFRAHILRTAPRGSKQGVFCGAHTHRKKAVYKTWALGHVELYITSVSRYTC